MKSARIQEKHLLPGIEKTVQKQARNKRLLPGITRKSGNNCVRSHIIKERKALKQQKRAKSVKPIKSPRIQ